MSKHRNIESFLQGVSTKLATCRSKARQEQRCVTCGGDARIFTSYLSEREYSISLMCQRCQDETFKGE